MTTVKIRPINLVPMLLLLSFLSLLGFSAEKTNKPNVIIVLTDDQGYCDLGVYGNKLIQTPNLDKLYQESIRLADFHVSPFCAPSRASLMTGRFPELTHVRATINGRNHLNKKETIMAEYFKESGYVTGHFGKWHLGRNYPFRPTDRGFDLSVSHGDGGIGTISDYWGNDKMNDMYMRNNKWERFKGFSSDVFFDESMSFMKKNKDKPFFVYLATNAPHWPWNIKKEWRDKYGDTLTKYDKRRKRSLADFYATITHIDDNVGRLRHFLSDQGLAKNTILIFMTDNGTSGSWGVYYAGMKGIKGTVYDGGHRVPCFIHWPAKKMTAGIDIKALTGHIDILPTLIDLCKLKTPAKASYKMSGKSLAGLLAGKKQSWPERALFVHCQNTEEYQKWRNSAVITKKWRLVNKDELYNIKSDPGQKTNVAANNPEVVASLRKKYDAYWSEIKAGKTPFQRPEVGSGKIDYTWLACDAWIADNKKPIIWNQPHVNEGLRNFGYWPLTVVRQATYTVEVRRWPKEIDWPISSVPELQTASDIELNKEPVFLPKGKIIKASKVKLRVGTQHYEKTITEKDSYARFNIEMKKGDTEIQAYLIDAKQKEFPAYYVYIYENK